MRKIDIENWALSILDRFKSGQPIEDSRIELKAQFPDVKKAARRIAGHANAARGENILWLIGVDEKADTISGADTSIDLANWFNQVKAEFDELAPELEHINVPYDGVTVIVLFFETDRAPFVVKNPEGKIPHREVPWRVGTAIQTATRSQLIRLLTPIQTLPKIESVAGLIKLTNWNSVKAGNIKDKEFIQINLQLTLFLTNLSTQESVFPSHRCKAIVMLPNHDDIIFETHFKWKNGGSPNIIAAKSCLTVRGSGQFEIEMELSFQFNDSVNYLNEIKRTKNGVKVDLHLYCNDAEKYITNHFNLTNLRSGLPISFYDRYYDFRN